MTKLIRIPDDLYAQIAKLAELEQRSITGQATYLLQQAVL